jgi:hypothetical protein
VADQQLAARLVDRADVIAQTCAFGQDRSFDAARDLILGQYPPSGRSTARGKWTEQSLLRIFVRDRFTDRYFGVRLIFPGTLRMLSLLMPAEFPYHPNWKQSETHPAFWELYPTVDHVVPLARGGRDDETNLVTTSMLRNGAKANWLLEELGWPTERAPVASNWDGMLSWFLSQWKANKQLHANSYLRQWHRAAVQLQAV